MKTLLVIAFLLPTMLFAQPYESIFAEEGETRWNVYVCTGDAGGTVAQITNDIKVINNQIYHKIISDYIYYPEDDDINWNYCVNYIREDINTGEYWFLWEIDGEYEEVLFMNLNSKVGDTIKIYRDLRYRDRYDPIVVDSIYYENDKKHLVFDEVHYNCLDKFKIEFIEGIGFSIGFYFAECALYVSYVSNSVLCKYENSEMIYQSKADHYGNCYLEGGGDIEEPIITFAISPNPATEFINIESESLNIEIELYNMLGISVLKATANEQIDVSGLPRGVYFIKIDEKTYKKLILH